MWEMGAARPKKREKKRDFGVNVVWVLNWANRAKFLFTGVFPKKGKLSPLEYGSKTSDHAYVQH